MGASGWLRGSLGGLSGGHDILEVDEREGGALCHLRAEPLALGLGPGRGLRPLCVGVVVPGLGRGVVRCPSRSAGGGEGVVGAGGGGGGGGVSGSSAVCLAACVMAAAFHRAPGSIPFTASSPS